MYRAMIARIGGTQVNPNSKPAFLKSASQDHETHFKLKI